MARIHRLVSVEVAVGIVVVIVGVLVHLHTSRLCDSPNTDSDKKEPNGELGPGRNRFEVEKPAKSETQPPDQQDSYPMTQTPFGPGGSGATRILSRYRRQSSEMVDACEHMKHPGCETGEYCYQVS